jgi:hypothetical protein
LAKRFAEPFLDQANKGLRVVHPYRRVLGRAGFNPFSDPFRLRQIGHHVVVGHPPERTRISPFRGVDGVVEISDAAREHSHFPIGPSQPDGNIGLALHQAEVARLPDEVEMQAGMVDQESRQRGNKDAIDHNRDGSDAHSPGDEVIRARNPGHDRLDFVLDPLRPLGHQPTGIGWNEPTLNTLEQARAKTPFQPGDSASNRCLVDSKTTTRFREPLEPHRGGNKAQIVPGHILHFVA